MSAYIIPPTPQIMNGNVGSIIDEFVVCFYAKLSKKLHKDKTAEKM